MGLGSEDKWTSVVLPWAHVALAENCPFRASTATVVVINCLRGVVHEDVLWHNGGHCCHLQQGQLMALLCEGNADLDRLELAAVH